MRYHLLMCSETAKVRSKDTTSATDPAPDPAETAPRALVPHPATPSDAVRGVTVHIARSAQGVLTLRYAVQAEHDALRLPPESAPQRVDGLWRHTCFEVFVREGTGASYLEFNFSPSRSWAAYRFSGYRDGVTRIEDQRAPAIELQRATHGLVLQASLVLPEAQRRGAQQAGLAAVLEECSGRISYWALAHPAGKPDFHHPTGFGLEI